MTKKISSEAEEAQQLVANIRAKAKQSKRRQPKKAASIVQLPLWPEPKRAAPNVVLRSALFGVGSRGGTEKRKRVYVEKTILAAWGDARITYAGPRLDQNDADVWMQALHFARKQNLAAKIHVSARTFLREMGLHSGGNAIARLDKSLHRLVGAVVSISDGKKTYVGTLVREFTKDEVSGHYVIELNPKLAKLFDGGYTRLDWVTRMELKGELTRWLQGFVLSHYAHASHPQRVGLEKLKALCGVAVEREMKGFRRDLRDAMNQLEEFGVVKNWRITENDALEFMRRVTKELAE